MTDPKNAEPEKLNLASFDIAAGKRAEILRLFPEAKTEGGKIDFLRLERLLGETVDPGKERYGFNWPGKANCFKTIQAPSYATLRPSMDESVNFDQTENLFIEGDNLEVLKLLQKSYLGKIKMIYIDPPYNTGNDFIYPDNYSESLQTYLKYTGQVDELGAKFGTNTEADGRFHSKWLNMMYPRLYLARNLLSDSGLIFVSADDHEIGSLKYLLNDIFGEENFCATFIWNSEGNTDNQYKIKVKHEYIIAYYRDANLSNAAVGRVIDPNTREDSNLWKGLADNNINKNGPENPPSIVTLPQGFPCAIEQLFYPAKKVDAEFFEVTQREKFISDEIRAKYQIENKSGLPVKLDDLRVEGGKLVAPCRIYGGVANKNKLLQFIEGGCVPIIDEGLPLKFYLNGNAAVRYQKANEHPRNILSVLSNFGTTEKTKTALRREGIPYDYPKPVGLIEYLIRIGCEAANGLILDFFAGSGTTAEALMSVNAADNGQRRFILVQLPEPLELSDEVQKAAAELCDKLGRPRNLAEVAKERIRRAAKRHRVSETDLLGQHEAKQDIGFRVFKLSESNFNAWDADGPSNAEGLEKQLSLHVGHLREQRSDLDFLYEILLKDGYPIAAPVQMEVVDDKTIFSVANGALIICLDRALTLECIRNIADQRPERVIFLDEGFVGNDQLKTNAVQTFKTKNIVFRTV